MLTVACVYRSGGDFTPDYVLRLRSGVARHLSVPYEFVCLTDRAEELQGVSLMPFAYLWPGWWSKMEVFALPGPILYFDLDTIITDSIDTLANWIMQADDNALLMLRDFYRRNEASGTLGWRSDMSLILQDFRDNYAANASWQKSSRAAAMRAKGTIFRGDQEWLRLFLKNHPQISVRFAQDVQLGLCSYKVHVQKSGGLPNGASVVCFHGLPRPHEVNPLPDWMREFWAEAEKVVQDG